MKIAIIGNQAFGLVNFRGALIRQLVDMGHRVSALVPDYTDETRAAVFALGATPIDHGLSRSGVNPFNDGLAAWQLHGTLKAIDPDLVLAYTVKPVVYGILAAKLAGVKRRYALIEGLGHAFIHSNTFKERLLQWCVAALYRLSLDSADKTFFLNADDEDEFFSRGLVRKARSQVVGTIGLDLEDWRFEPPNIDPLTFLFIGRVLREKGVGEFIDAARLIRAEYPLTRFVIVGDVDSNPSSFGRDVLMNWVSEGLIEWPGHTDVKPWIANSSVFVLPSYREGFPRATQEAMAMGRPIITTDVPGCRETVVEGRNGFLIPAQSADALAGAMRCFLEQPSLVVTMGAHSREIAEQRFDTNAATNRLVAAIGLWR